MINLRQEHSIPIRTPPPPVKLAKKLQSTLSYEH